LKFLLLKKKIVKNYKRVITGDMGVHIVPKKTRASQQVWGMDQPRYGGRGRRPVPAFRGVVALYDVG